MCLVDFTSLFKLSCQGERGFLFGFLCANARLMRMSSNATLESFTIRLTAEFDSMTVHIVFEPVSKSSIY